MAVSPCEASVCLFTSRRWETPPHRIKRTSAHQAAIKPCIWRCFGVQKEAACVIISEHFHLVWVRLLNWNQWWKKNRINDQSHISMVGLVFAYRKVKDGCTYYTPAPTPTLTFTPSITVLTEFFFLITENKVSPLLPPPPPLHTCLAKLLRLQTAHPTDTVKNLPCSLQQHPISFSFSPWSPPASLRLLPSFLLTCIQMIRLKPSIINCWHADALNEGRTSHGFERGGGGGGREDITPKK